MEENDIIQIVIGEKRLGTDDQGVAPDPVETEPEPETDDKAVWSTAMINDLPDDAFLWIETGGEKDDQGKTTPRSLRHLPYKDASGDVDLPHVRNAIARAPQMKDKEGKKVGSQVVQRIQAKARKILEEETAKGEKAGRRIRTDKTGILRGIRDRLSDVIEQVASVLNWAEYVDQEPETEPEPALEPGAILEMLGSKDHAFYTFKGADDRTWMLSFTTNAFRDREGEIFTTKSIEEYVQRHAQDDVKGEFWFWHLPGTKFGDIRWQSTIGRFLVEAGPFDDTPVGMAFKEFFQKNPSGHTAIAPMGWGMSHGYWYNPEDRKDRVYEWFDKKESTVLPAHVASNPFTSMEVLQMAMTEEQKQALEAIGGKALVNAVTTAGEARTKELEQAGVAFKSVDAEPETEPEPEPETPPVEDEKAKKASEVDAVLAKIADEGVRNMVKELMAKVAAGDVKMDMEEEYPEEEKKKPGAKEAETEAGSKEAPEPTEPNQPEPLTREEVGAAIKAMAEMFRAEIKEQYDQIEAELAEKLRPVLDGVKEMREEDEAKIAKKAAEIPAASLQQIIEESVFGAKNVIDGRSSLAKSGPTETEPPIADRTGIPGLDWMISRPSQ